jgi:hypothetical protein
LRGSSAMNCSPTALVLCTSTSKSDGMSMPEFNSISASTPESVSRTLFTWPTSVPR